MKVAIFFSILIILHIIAFLGLLMAWLGVLSPLLFRISLIVIGVLILIDIILGLYFLISKPSKKEGTRYHKLKIEEADKQTTEKEK